MYTSTSDSIKVTVEAHFLDEQSSPEDHQYVWAYTILIENKGKSKVQLRTRQWTITDAFGRIEEYTGEGVVGEKPILEPGDSFHYTSSVPLPTPSGLMMGSYEMLKDIKNMVQVEIPCFSLDSPYDIQSIH
jgi:ApaG protein